MDEIKELVHAITELVRAVVELIRILFLFLIRRKSG